MSLDHTKPIAQRLRQRSLSGDWVVDFPKPRSGGGCPQEVWFWLYEQFGTTVRKKYQVYLGGVVFENYVDALLCYMNFAE
jgi:hypothetical protein